MKKQTVIGLILAAVLVTFLVIGVYRSKNVSGDGKMSGKETAAVNKTEEPSPEEILRTALNSNDGQTIYDAAKAASPEVFAAAMKNAPRRAVPLALRSASPEAIKALVAGNANPASDFTYDLNDKENGIIIKKYTGRKPHLIIPSEIEGYPVVQIGTGKKTPMLSGIDIWEGITTLNENAKDYNDNWTGLEAVVIPEGVTIIARYAFRNLKLETVVLPSSLAEIQEYAFADNKNLKQINFSACGNLRIIKDFAFSYTALGNINLSKIPLAELGSGAFGHCEQLRTVKLPDTLAYIGNEYWGNGTFEYCPKLTDINLPSGLKALYGSTFYQCKELANLTIPDSLTTVKFIDRTYDTRTFNGCDKLPIATRLQLKKLGYSGEF